MRSAAERELVDRLARYDSLLEVGIGRRPGVAATLASAGCRVVATDVDPAAVVDARKRVPSDVQVYRDDVVDVVGRESLEPRYDVEAVYGRNLQAELQRPARTLARRIDADCLFTTLGFEEPVIPVERRRVGEDVLYVARR